MYLGVHTPYDVGASLIVGVLISFVVSALVDKIEQSQKQYWNMQLAIMLLMFVGYVFLFHKAKTGDCFYSAEVTNSLENYAKVSGLTLAWMIVYCSSNQEQFGKATCNPI